MSHPRQELDPVLANPLRFSLLACLGNVVDMKFKEMRDHLVTTDSTLSKHSAALEEVGYIKIEKSFLGKTPQTRFSITKAGQEALTNHIRTLNRIVEEG